MKASGSSQCVSTLRANYRSCLGRGASWTGPRCDWRLGDIELPASLPTVVELYGAVLTGWRSLAAETGVDSFLGPWALRHLDRLAELEPDW
jgi:hypothetical protein